MRILIVTVGYPSRDSSHRAYIHARAKVYKKLKHGVYVFVPSNVNQCYNLEGVDVEWGTYSRMIDCLGKFSPDAIALHSPTVPIQYHSKIFGDLPIVAWMHGFSSLVHAFHPRYSPWQVKKKVRSLVIDPIKLLALRRFLKRIFAPVYVSRWVQRVTEIYTCFRHRNSAVIPNPIDTELFKPANNKEKALKRGVSVRNMGWKYGLDIAIRAYSCLEQSNLTVIGRAPSDPKNELFLRNLAAECQSSVTFVTKAFNHNLMPAIYRKYDYFVNPARTEAQGVAMCEAMACGLPVIATNVGGTPEFVIDGYNGFLTTLEPVSIRKAIPRIVDNSTYRELSQNARRFVVKNLRAENLCQKEIDLMERAIRS